MNVQNKNVEISSVENDLSNDVNNLRTANRKLRNENEYLKVFSVKTAKSL